MLKFLRKRKTTKPAHALALPEVKFHPEVKSHPNVLRLRRLAAQGIKPISIGTPWHIETLDINVIPLELVLYTLDFLWYDKATLRACSLVCTWWRLAAQAHIFEKIVLHHDVDFRSWTRRFEEHPDIARHVQILCIHCLPEPPVACAAGPHVYLNTHWVLPALEDLGLRLTAVREISFHGYRNQEHFVLNDALRMMLCTHFSSIKRLTLDHVQLSMCNAQSVILSSFEHLTSLGLSDVIFMPSHQQVPIQHAPAISTLSLGTNDSPALSVAMLQKCHALDKARTLGVEMPVSGTQIRKLSELLGIVEGSLKRLIVKGSTKAELPINLEHIAGLEHLIFCGVWQTDQHSPDLWLVSILRTVPKTSSLGEITFIVNYDHQPSDCADIDWIAVHSALEHISRLGRINVAYVANMSRRTGLSSAEYRAKLSSSLEYEGACLASKARQELLDFCKRGLLRVYWSVKQTHPNDVTWMLRDKYLC